jgi:hypothetical protein
VKDSKGPKAEVETPHKLKIEDEKPGQSAVGKHSKTQREQNEEARSAVGAVAPSTAGPN